jgi:molybdate transport system substrate-binding protein
MLTTFRLCRLFRRTKRALAWAATVAGVLVVAIAGGGAKAYAQQPGSTQLSEAKPGEVRLFVAGSLRVPFLAVKDRVEAVTGRKVVFESSESRNLEKEIDAGQPFEAALLTSVVVDELVANGKIVAGSKTRIGTVGVGVAVRGDAPKLDVSTAEGLKRAILGAHGIRRFYGVAASVPVLENLFAKLGVVEATQDKMIRLGGAEAVPEARLPPGQYELIINLISAAKPLKGWTYLGPIPEEFQMPLDHSAGWVRPAISPSAGRCCR